MKTVGTFLALTIFFRDRSCVSNEFKKEIKRKKIKPKIFRKFSNSSSENSNDENSHRILHKIKSWKRKIPTEKLKIIDMFELWGDQQHDLDCLNKSSSFRNLKSDKQNLSNKLDDQNRSSSKNLEWGMKSTKQDSSQFNRQTSRIEDESKQFKIKVSLES